MKKTIFKVLACIAFAFQTSYVVAQNPAWIVAPNYFDATLIPQPLPTVGPINTNYWEGYKGQPASSAQNILADTSGNIVFFIVDQYIYDRNGELIDVFMADGSQGFEYVAGTPSEIVVVPAPQDCHSYYLFAAALGDFSVGNVQGPSGYYGKLTVTYDGFGNLLDGSGLELADVNTPCGKAHWLGDLIGSIYEATNNVHDESPFYGAVKKSTDTTDFFVFIRNGSKIFRLTVSSNGVSYDNTYIDFWNEIAGASFIAENINHRHELEVIPLDNGNYRLATAVQYQAGAGIPPNNAVLVVDLDPFGNVISSRTLDYVDDAGISEPTFYIKSIEFSDNGERLYVSHVKTGSHQSSLDVFDLTGPTPVMSVISTSDDYQHSQIEATFDNTLLVAKNNGLAQIENAGNAAYVFTPNVITLPGYGLSNPSGGGNPSYSSFLLQDQIDGYDYRKIPNDVFHADSYIVSGNEVWERNDVGFNPLIDGNDTVAYVRREIRILPNASLTIHNLQLRFAPGARVVIENGVGGQQGGILRLRDSTILTNENRCDENELWLGVEVWGNQNLPQENINNSTQGRLVMTNSIIENALIGALVSKRNSIEEESFYLTGDCISGAVTVYDDPIEVVQGNDFVDANNGGIVQTSQSHFLNNELGVVFRPYLAPSVTAMNNRSHFFRTNFHWTDDYLLPDLGWTFFGFATHARLMSVHGVNFKGCEFMNLISEGNSSHYLGEGIVSTESQFYVTPYCPTIVQYGTPCPNPTPSRFSNLDNGIIAVNSVNDLKTFTCSENEFSDNKVGILVSGTKDERILRNDFAVRQTDTYQTAGIALYNSTRYTVQENELYALDNPLVAADQANTYGIVVNNSGETTNEIYKNYFHDLKIGGQTEGTNATSVPDPTNSIITGLQWKCNDFQSDIENHDLTLMSGRMNYHQGSSSGGTSLLDAKKRAANNKFSLTAESPSIDHDFYLSDYSQHVEYAHLNAARHIPDSYTVFNLSPFGGGLQQAVTPVSAQYGGPITDDAGACPSKIVKKVPSISLPAIFQFRDTAEDLGDQIDGGNTTELLDLIETGSNGQVKNGLMAASPYLSDEVLIRYIQSNPPHGHLKQVLMANSQLSERVKSVLVNHSMPNGTANQIADVQEGMSERTKLYAEIYYLLGEADLEYNDLISQLLLDESDTLNVQVIIDVMEAVGDHERLKQLLSLYIGIDDTSRAQQTRVQLEADNACVYFMELKEIHQEISCKKDPREVLEENPSLVTRLEVLIANSEDEMIALSADYLLNYYYNNLMEGVPLFLTDAVNKSMFIPTETKEKIDLHRNVGVNIYPNPTTGRVNFDYPDQSSGTMEIKIISIDGKVMMEFSATETNGESVDVGHLQKGYYLVKITLDGEELETQKLEVF